MRDPGNEVVCRQTDSLNKHCKEWEMISSTSSLVIGFVWVLENLESPGILLKHFPGPMSHWGKWD